MNHAVVFAVPSFRENGKIAILKANNKSSVEQVVDD